MMDSQKFKKYFGFLVLGALLVVAILVWTAVFARAQSVGQLEVHFFDTGQGKTIFIEEPGGRQILIDGGPDNAVLEKLSGEMPFFDREIDLVILTHSDSDHLNGLIEVLKRYSISQIIETGANDSSAGYSAWQNLIKEKKIPVAIAMAGQKIKIGDLFLLEILYPTASVAGQNFKNSNYASIVSRLDYGQNSFLFTGDAEGPAESFLVYASQKLDVDILDVAHHGSKNSTSQEFLQAVTPQVAVIQAGVKNRYNHPSPETLERLKGLKILRTDICRDIDILSNGASYSVNSQCQ